jgi:hypothetical protein
MAPQYWESKGDRSGQVARTCGQVTGRKVLPSDHHHNSSMLPKGRGEVGPAQPLPAFEALKVMGSGEQGLLRIPTEYQCETRAQRLRLDRNPILETVREKESKLARYFCSSRTLPGHE